MEKKKQKDVSGRTIDGNVQRDCDVCKEMQGVWYGD